MVSLAEVLSTGIRVEVVACPDPGASVRWVATNELTDPSPFLEGGELLLFTGLETRGWDASEWAQYVEHLRVSRVSALGLATGLTHATVPEALVDACAQREINLLTIPMGVSFVSISQAVAGLLEVRDRTAAQEAVALQRRLAQAARRRDAASAIADELARHLSGSVWLLGPDGSLTSQATYDAGPVNDLTEIRNELATLRSRGLGAVASWASASGNTVVQPVGLREPPEAYIAVRSPEVPTDYQRTAIMASTALLSLELDRRLEQREASRKLRRRAFDLLLSGEVRAAEIILDTAGTQGFSHSLQPADRLRAIRARAPRDDLLRQLSRAEAVAYVGLIALAADEDELHVLCGDSASQSWISLLSSGNMTVGVGGPVRPTEIERSFRSAGYALEEATPQRPTVTWEDLSDSGLAALVAPTVLEAFAEDLLGRLEETVFGREHLAKVASAFIRHHGRVNVVAEELGMHRNTVRTRLREIERAVGLDLDDPTARLNLWAALQIARKLDSPAHLSGGLAVRPN